MNFLETFRTGLEAVMAHRLRSMLTMLGILIGIAAVILTVGLGEGAQASVSSAINSLGSNLLIVSPGSSTGGSGVQGGLGTSSTLTTGDATALGSKVVAPDIAAVAPTTQRSEVLSAGPATWTTAVVGTTSQWSQVRARKVEAGHFLTASEVASHADVTVLAPITAQSLFGNADPVGRTVNVAGVPMTVVGVLAPAGSSATSNQDDQALVPVTTAADPLFGGANRSSVQSILIEASSSKPLSAAYQEATDELLALHHITSPAAADFVISSQQSLLSTASSITKTLTLLLGGVAAISLLVGGIGVMNIMLVSVTERVREIGLRKALGAKPATIRNQFLVEASVLGMVGGVLGSALGGGAALLLSASISFHVVVSPVAVLVAVGVAMAIATGFGVYPAARAARLAPIEALRSE